MRMQARSLSPVTFPRKMSITVEGFWVHLLQSISVFEFVASREFIYHLVRASVYAVLRFEITRSFGQHMKPVYERCSALTCESDFGHDYELFSSSGMLRHV